MESRSEGTGEGAGYQDHSAEYGTGVRGTCSAGLYRSRSGKNGYRSADPAFAGTDVRGTAHQVLAQAVRVIEKREGIRADAVSCGAKTVDGGTSMLGWNLLIPGSPPGDLCLALHYDADTGRAGGNRSAGSDRENWSAGSIRGKQVLRKCPQGTGTRGFWPFVWRRKMTGAIGSTVFLLPCLVTFTKASFQVPLSA